MCVCHHLAQSVESGCEVIMYLFLLVSNKKSIDQKKGRTTKWKKSGCLSDWVEYSDLHTILDGSISQK